MQKFFGPPVVEDDDSAGRVFMGASKVFLGAARNTFWNAAQSCRSTSPSISLSKNRQASSIGSTSGPLEAIQKGPVVASEGNPSPSKHRRRFAYCQTCDHPPCDGDEPVLGIGNVGLIVHVVSHGRSEPSDLKARL